MKNKKQKQKQIYMQTLKHQKAIFDAKQKQNLSNSVAYSSYGTMQFCFQSWNEKA